jgi:hypothetical protein
MLLTTDCVIADKPKPAGDNSSMQGGWMWGMGWMWWMGGMWWMM